MSTYSSDKEYTLSDFTSLPKKFLKLKEYHTFYETFEYPGYERICQRIQRYIGVSPAETLENMMSFDSDGNGKARLYNALAILDAIKDGDLTCLKKMHNEGHCIGFYKSCVMGTAVKYKHLHIIDYLYNKEPRRYGDWNFLGRGFPILEHIAKSATEEVEEKRKNERVAFSNTIKDLESRLQKIATLSDRVLIN